MRHNLTIRHEFVEFIPDVLSAGVVYVSISYATAAHNCFCGCGNKVVTPLSRKGWSVTYNGESVSLHPSVGNYGLPCQSHYFIRGDQVLWARNMSQQEVDADRLRDGLLPSSDRSKLVASDLSSSVARRLFGWLRGN